MTATLSVVEFCRLRIRRVSSSGSRLASTSPTGSSVERRMMTSRVLHLSTQFHLPHTFVFSDVHTDFTASPFVDFAGGLRRAATE